jgi:hypothetical protein
VETLKGLALVTLRVNINCDGEYKYLLLVNYQYEYFQLLLPTSDSHLGQSQLRYPSTHSCI